MAPSGPISPVDERLLSVDGEIERTVRGRTWRPARGEAVFAPAGASPTVRAGGGTTRRWGYDYLAPPSLDQESPS